MGTVFHSGDDVCEINDALLERLEDAGIVAEEAQTATRLTDLDEAVIGYADENRLVYSYEKLIETCMKVHSMDIIDATDYVDHDILQWYQQYGDQPPIIMYEVGNGVKD